MGPRVPDDEQLLYCVKNIYLPGPLGISLNCDSPVFLEDAANPSLLLAENSVYQGRPLHITTVGMLGYPVRLITTPIIRALNLDEQMGFGLDIIGKENEFRDTTFNSQEDVASGIELFVPYFITYFLFDVLLLAGAFWMFVRLVSPEKGWQDAPLAVLLVGLLLAVNDLSKAYLLTPHSQTFNLFVPIFCLFAFMQLATKPSRRSVLILAVIAGLGMLAYAYFAVAVPVGIVALLVYWLPRDGWWPAVRRIFVDALLLLVITLMPTLAWMGFVIARNGSFFSFEVACCRQIVWIGDAWNAGGFGEVVSQFWGKLIFFAQYGFVLSIIPLLMGVLVVVFAGWHLNWRENGSINSAQGKRIRLLLTGILTVSGMSWLFYSFLGYTVTRLATGIALPMVVLVGLLAQEAATKSDRAQRLVNVVVLVGITAVIIYTLVKPGPYS